MVIGGDGCTEKSKNKRKGEKVIRGEIPGRKRRLRENERKQEKVQNR